MNKELIYIDLFSGVGGFSKGFEDAGLNIKHHYFSEIDKHAIAVYKYHFKNANYVGSVTDVSGIELRRKHPGAKFIITFGFPCQDLSIAGKGKGLSGERSGLFFEAIRIVKEVKPEVFIFENVKGLLSSNEGKDFETVLRTIADIGLYECEWQLINTRWVLPQNRERIYFVGHLGGRSRPRVFPFRKNDSEFSEYKGKGIRLFSGTIDSNYWKGPDGKRTMILRWQNKKDGIVSDDIAPSLRASQGTDIRKKPVVVQSNTKKKLRYSQRRRFKEDGEPAFTLNTQDQHGVQIDSSIRRLTETECERLQGFPDNWTQYGDYDGEIKKVAKTNRYKQMGNAVTVDWPRMIAKRLFK